MLPSSGFKARATVWCACSLFISLLAGCSQPAAPPPVLSSWSEQMAAMERALQGMGSDLVLVSGEIMPVRDRQGAPDEPIELRSTFLFVSPKSSKVDAEGKPRYTGRIVHYNDHRLATTLRVDDELQTIVSADPKSGESARLIRLSPQDILRLTMTEGKPHLKEPVNAGNIVINLVRVSEVPTDVNALAVWKISYGGTLSIWVDAQTGAILKRSTKDK